MKEELKEKVKEMDKLILEAEKSLKKAPKGSLVLSKSNGVTQYYHKTENTQKKGKYISSKNKKIIAALAQKDYDLRFLQVIKKQKKQIQKAIKLLPDIDLARIHTELSEGRKRYVKPYVLSDEQYVEQWLGVKYTGKEFFDDTHVIMTERGERVRSKSEKILADKLFAMGIPYRYEYPVQLKGYGTVYPDFTLLNVRKRKEFYLEHFGIMDDPEYSEKAIKKLEDYAKNKIYIGKNLLVTFETRHKPLEMKVVEQMIKEFIL